MKKRIAVFVSGTGSNFKAILEKTEAGDINAEIVLVVSSNPTAGALSIAENSQIKTHVINFKDKSKINSEYVIVSDLLTVLNIDYIVLAGYIKILPAFFVKKYLGRMINIHPSLIPKFSGVGYYGHKVHESVLAARENESGCTVHFVDEGVDTGEIIMQAIVPVFGDDTPDTLAARVLIEEHKILPLALKKLCAD
ncbi:MAG: phosphoribosylglycinamide formyltransferase [Christensenellaceae bacterium]|jgi:formyltetrahydrofolate-dependent phosphoribosylglycinamide formyltransferase|nr:phosphoribosylglycinamide formyltransferase [Christensenellaceae bacterium]